MDIQQFEQRKKDHIELALKESNQGSTTGLECIRLAHRAIPELNFDHIRLDSDFFGKAAASPLFISSMTAGHKDGEALNIRLARLAGLAKWPMGLGSQRRELVDPDATSEWKRLRKEAPETTLMGNIGLSQLLEVSTDAIQKLVDNVEATALFIHCNPLQELIQPEGTPNFAGTLKNLEAVCRQIPCPVILKETGCGFSADDVKQVLNTGLAAIDISGYGGTHWGRIEGGRAVKTSVQYAASQTFANWGIPTAESLESTVSVLRKASSNLPVWASGGIRTGLDAAKCIALGAEKVGVAKPALEAALAGESEFLFWVRRMEYELRVALFCTGSASPMELREGQKWQRI